jgi:hypothetical protein
VRTRESPSGEGLSADRSVVRFAGATAVGADLVVREERARIDSDRGDSDRGAITAVEEQELYRYYGLDDRQFSGKSTPEPDRCPRGR